MADPNALPHRSERELRALVTGLSSLLDEAEAALLYVVYEADSFDQARHAAETGLRAVLGRDPEVNDRRPGV